MDKIFGVMTPGPNFEGARTQAVTPFFKLDLALDAAGVNQIFDIAGDFLYIDPSSTGVITLEVNNQYSDSEAPFIAQPGFALEAVFKRLKLNWTAQTGKTVRIIYSTGARIRPTNTGQITGTVYVADQSETRTIQNGSYLGGANSGAVAAQMSHVQLFNAIGSGKRCVVEATSFSATAASTVLVYSSNAALTLYGSCVNKHVGNGNSITKLYTTNNAAAQGVFQMLSYPIGAGVVQTINLREPIVLEPGQGVTVINSTVNTALSANFEMYEYAI